jgi:DNA processing protein
MRLRLVRSRRVGPATYLRLMAEHGHAEAALAALPGIAGRRACQDYAPCPEPVARPSCAPPSALGATLLCLGDAAYPEALARITDPPPVLWALGDTDLLLTGPCRCHVGTRNASALGARMARRLARDLGEAGFVVVSGLARGIDALAHEAALETGTVAVHAGGLDVLYPPRTPSLRGASANGPEAQRNALRPAAPGPPFPAPQPDRVGAGGSRDRGGGGGAVGIADHRALALDQGREVMAVPGHPLDSRASGGNILLARRRDAGARRR